jgi:hypothetical protein
MAPAHLGQELAGQELGEVGKPVQLPQDAYVSGGGRVDYDTPPAPGEVRDLDLATIRRGRSEIRVGLQTGKLFGETLAPGEEHAFDFLRAALR